jgi:hypothetical protein
METILWGCVFVALTIIVGWLVYATLKGMGSP